MKLSTKIFLPIILISALLILLNGCFGVPSPGYTPETGTITGIIAAPCCSTSADPVSETCCIAPEYWCFYCQGNWLLQDSIGVVLTYGEDVVAATTTNKYGEFTFTNVSPGKNYVITAYCPDYDDNRPLVKDVALELIEGGSFDTNITDLVSTSLGLVVDFLVLYTEWGPEDISLDEVLADRPNFPNFPKFKALIYEVRRVVENCEVNLLTDDDVQYATCRAAEEISKLDIGCGPEYTAPPPEPDPCEGNDAPDITEVKINDTPYSSGSTIDVVVGTLYKVEVTATDDGKKQALTYSLAITKGADKINIDMGTNPSYEETPSTGDVGTYEVVLNVYDGCAPTPWTVTVNVGCNEPPEITSLPITTVCLGDGYTYDVNATDPEVDVLTYSLTTWPTHMTIDPSTGLITWTPASGQIGDNDVTVEVSDGCSSDTQAFVVTVDAGLTGATFADTYAFTICSDETLDIGSLVTIVPEFGGVAGTPVTLTELIALGGYVVDASDGSFSFSGTEIIGSSSGSGSGTLTVTYVDPNHDVCGLAEFEIVATIGVTVDAGLTGAEFADTYAFTICSDGTLDIDSLVMITPYYGGVAGTDITLTAFLAIPGTSMNETSDGSFSLSGTEISGTSSGAGSGTLTVSYVDPTPDDCGTAEFTIEGTIGVTVEECLDCFILNVKAGGETHVWAYETIEPGVVYSIIESDSNASKFQFMINCPQGTLEYNYYRGFNCGADWESGDQTTIPPDPNLSPPSWLTDDGLVNGVFFPTNINQGLLLCEKGGNILKIRVNEDDNLIFTFKIDRGISPTP